MSSCALNVVSLARFKCVARGTQQTTLYEKFVQFGLRRLERNTIAANSRHAVVGIAFYRCIFVRELHYMFESFEIVKTAFFALANFVLFRVHVRILLVSVTTMVLCLLLFGCVVRHFLPCWEIALKNVV